MVSIKEVAKQAGVSISTVSRVINKSIPVNPKTRVRVEDAINTLQYRPNLVAKGLRGQSSKLIGLVVPEIRNSHAFVSIIQFIEENSADHDYSVIVGNNHNNPDIEEKFIDTLIRRNVDGIIFSRVSDESKVLNTLNSAKLPVVIIDRSFHKEKYSSIVLNNVKAGQIAANHFLSLGHRHIACITGPSSIKLVRERLNGFRKELKDKQITLAKQNIFEGDFSFASGVVGVKHLLKKESNITAIWAQNDLMGVGVINELTKQGIRVPEDISVMGMDDIDIAKMTNPSLTSIRQPFYEISKSAVEILIKQIESKEIMNFNIVFEPALKVRESTSPVG